MTITEPLATESAIEPTTAPVPVDEPTIDLTDAAARMPQLEVVVERTSLLRDPLLPFLVLGTLSLLAVVITAFLLSSPV